MQILQLTRNTFGPPLLHANILFSSRLLLNVKKEKSDIEEQVDLKGVYNYCLEHYLAKVLTGLEMSKGEESQDS